jgi:hypothetical protein
LAKVRRASKASVYLVVLGEHATHRVLRAQELAILEELRLDLRRCLVHERLTVERREHLRALLVRQCASWPRLRLGVGLGCCARQSLARLTPRDASRTADAVLEDES